MKKRSNFNDKKFNEDVYESFAAYIDVENEEIKKLQKEIEKLNLLNKELKAENDKLKKEIKKLKENPQNKKYPIGEIRKKIQKEYDFLCEESREALISVEYMYLNEREDMDFSGVYMGYLKPLEIELKKRIKLDRVTTLGSLLDKLEEARIFKGLVKILDKDKVIRNRNRGAHRGSIKKIECGKIRKTLLEEGWLRRVVDYFDNLD